jgi:hypothetical protein
LDVHLAVDKRIKDINQQSEAPPITELKKVRLRKSNKTIAALPKAAHKRIQNKRRKMK